MPSVTTLSKELMLAEGVSAVTSISLSKRQLPSLMARRTLPWVVTPVALMNTVSTRLPLAPGVKMVTGFVPARVPAALSVPLPCLGVAAKFAADAILFCLSWLGCWLTKSNDRLLFVNLQERSVGGRHGQAHHVHPRAIVPQIFAGGTRGRSGHQ